MRASPSKTRVLLSDEGEVEGKRQQLFYYSCLIGVICGDLARELSEFAENN